MAKATSASDRLTCWPTPVRVRWRSAARRPVAAVMPVAMSHAGTALISAPGVPKTPWIDCPVFFRPHSCPKDVSVGVRVA